MPPSFSEGMRQRMGQRRKVMAVFGTRPEAIKMAPVVKELQAHPEWFETIVCVTAQHRQMLDQVLSAFAIEPNHDLNIMQERQTLADVHIRALEGLGQVIAAERPHMLLVHGDTATTFAGALAAFYHQVAIAHVEAGLRAYNKYSPWPEEMNRCLTDVLADVMLAPTLNNRENLLREGVAPEKIYVTGQTAVDALLLTLQDEYRFTVPGLAAFDFTGKRVIAVTAHRRENYGEPFRQMFTAMRELVDAFPDTFLIYPVHLSPAVREVAQPLLLGHPRIMLIDPVPYPDMVHLLKRSYLVLSDSGGLQEETPSLAKPLILMRDTTERPEGVAAGTVIVAGTSQQRIYDEAARLLADAGVYRAMAQRANPYGDGQAARRCVQAIAHFFNLSARPDEFKPGAVAN